MILLLLQAALAGADAVEATSADVVQVLARTRPLAPPLDAWLRARGVVLPGAAQPQSGAGVVAGTDRVITSHHTVSGAAEVVVRRWRDGALVDVPGWVRRVDAAADLAVIEVDGVAPSRPWLASDTLRPGQPMWLLGFPGEDALLVSGGVVSGRMDRALRGVALPWVVVDAVVRPGMSGGPMVDAEGRVRGLVAGGFLAGTALEGFGLITPAERALELLEAPEPASGALRVEADVVVELDDVARRAGLAVGDRLADPLPTSRPAVIRREDGAYVVLAAP